MWLGPLTVSSLERCPLFRVSFIERLHCITPRYFPLWLMIYIRERWFTRSFALLSLFWKWHVLSWHLLYPHNELRTSSPSPPKSKYRQTAFTDVQITQYSSWQRVLHASDECVHVATDWWMKPSPAVVSLPLLHLRMIQWVQISVLVSWTEQRCAKCYLDMLVRM